jgi:hypothetical protein
VAQQYIDLKKEYQVFVTRGHMLGKVNGLAVLGEDADVAEVTVSRALLNYYQRTLAAFCNALKDFCTRRGATYVLTDSAQSVERLVLEQLRSARLLGVGGCCASRRRP